MHTARRWAAALALAAWASGAAAASPSSPSSASAPASSASAPGAFGVVPKGAAEFMALAQPVVALTHVELWDGTGALPIADATIVVREGRIAALGPAASVAVPADAVVHDLAGHSVTPGFVMVHEHLFYPMKRGSYGAMFGTFPALYLAGGATTIRTAGSMSPYADLNLEKDIVAGREIGPDMDVTAPFFNGEEPFVMQVQRIGSDRQARDMVAYWASEGATSYKGYMTLKKPQLDVLVREAHKRRQKVTAHLCGVTYREAVDLGIDDLEHGFLVASDFVRDKRPDECPMGGRVEASLAALAVDAPEMRALQRHIIDRHVAITSTLTIFETFTPGRPIAPQGALDLLIPELRENYLARWSALQQPQAQRPVDKAWIELFPKEMAWERRFVEAGGLLLAGTDPTGYGGVVPGFSNVREIELLEEAGFTRAQALRIACLNGAIFLGREADVGSLAPGKRADLVLYKGSLAQDPAGLRNIVWTMKAGVAWDRAKLLAANRGKVGLE
jgi:imidazolonepropionase-like amidohydrolase